MKIYIYPPPIGYPEIPHRLFLHAENKDDRRTLRRLIGDYVTTNAGKDGTDEWQHVAVELKPKESE